MSNYNHSAERSRLTRAINSGDDDKVIAACRHAVATWEDKLGGIWPDDWHRWNVAIGDTERYRFHTLSDVI